MKLSPCLQPVLFILLFLDARAQGEHWDTYMSRFGKKPGSVLVDMARISDAPDKKYPFLVITGPKAQNCSKQGIPDKDEIATLEEMLDATGSFITGVTAMVLTGTFTYNCERLNYYYVKDTVNVRTAVNRLYSRNYKNYSYAVNIKSDPDWMVYRTFLYPDEATLNWMENNKIIAGMMQNGDSLKNKKEIGFELYFRSDTARKAFADFARGQGYNTDKLILSKSPNTPYEIIVSKYTFVKMDVIDSFSHELKREAKRHGGYYNGWEAR